MTRPLRIQFEGAVYHVTSRGNDKGNIFRDDRDRFIFLSTLAKVADRYSWNCHGYCLMKNHYHILIETPHGNLAEGMRQLNGIYTQHVNSRHGRSGHVFQGRYAAVLIQKDGHLLEVCRYIILNPVRAGAVKLPGQWRWSSYGAMAGMEKAPEFLVTDWILAQFGNDRRIAQKRFIQFILDVVGAKSSIWEGLKGGIYYGDEGFIKKHVANGKMAEVPRRETNPLRPSLKEILGKGETVNNIRSALKEGYKTVEVARYLGVHYTTVSQRLRRAGGN